MLPEGYTGPVTVMDPPRYWPVVPFDASRLNTVTSNVWLGSTESGMSIETSTTPGFSWGTDGDVAQFAAYWALIWQPASTPPAAAPSAAVLSHPDTAMQPPSGPHPSTQRTWRRWPRARGS